MQRRSFINFVMGIGAIGSIGAIFYPIIEYLIPPDTGEPNVTAMKAGSFSEFENNSSKIVKFGRTPVILIKDTQGDLRAYAATCTHLDCIVQYKKDSKQIICACHNGVYDLQGRNVSGPPPKPLEEFDVKVMEDEIIITTRKS